MHILHHDALSTALTFLNEGRLVAFPTETVYGLGADMTQPQAIFKIFDLKNRPRQHPLIVHVADAQALWDCVEHRAVRSYQSVIQALISAFSPGPLTYILPKAPHVLDEVTGSQPSVGLRIPSHPMALRLLKAYPHPLVAPSANQFGHISPHTACHVREEGFPKEEVYVLDEAPDTEEAHVIKGVESTIIRFVPEGCYVDILRPGAITPGMIASVLVPHGWHVRFRGQILQEDELLLQASLLLPSNGNTLRVPGVLKKHYAPKQPLYRFESWEALQKHLDTALQSVHKPDVLALISPFESLPQVLQSASITYQHWSIVPVPEMWEHTLYSTLHHLDAYTQAQRVLGKSVLQAVIPPYTMPHDTLVPHSPITDWLAVWDRLERASVHPEV
jgi:L-threonylcarbamoyladenylate synthase